MSNFEYIVAFVSIVVGLAVTDLLTSLHRLLRARRHVRWDWLPLLAAVLVVLLVVEFWWGFYTLGQLDAWRSYGRFLVLLCMLVIAFLLASAALPDHVGDEGVDLRAFYAGNASYFWILVALFVAAANVTALVAVAGRVTIWQFAGGRASNLVFIAVAVSLAVIRRRWYHVTLVPLIVLGLAAIWTRVQLRPG